MTVEQFLEEFHGDLDLANEKLVQFSLSSREKSYDSPPKGHSKKQRKITRKKQEDLNE